MKTRFGKAHIDKPTPRWALVIQDLLDWAFGTIATGVLMVPDEWVWWEYVVAGSGALSVLWGRIKMRFGLESEHHTMKESLADSYKEQ